MKRKQAVILKKIVLLILIPISFCFMNVIEYSYENKYLNGFLVIVLAFILTHIIDNDKFYIDTGIKMHQLGDENSLNRKKYNLFNNEHKFIALYNMIVSFLFIFILFASAIMMLF